MATELVNVLATSVAQQRLWFLDQLQPGSPAYNIPIAAQLGGRLDVAALERSLAELVGRHETLRTTVRAREGEPVQVIAPALEVPLPVADLRGLPYDQRLREARQRAEDEARQPFRLADGPLLRARLVRLDEEEHVLLLTVHHIVADGWSLGVLFGELGTLYQAHRRGEQPQLAELPVQYADYATWQREWLQGERLERSLSYWRERLRGAPAVLELPTDHPRPAIPDLAGALLSRSLASELGQRVRGLARAEGVTVFMTLLAAFTALLARYSGRDDVVVGTPTSGRSRAETRGLIGCFANILVLRTDLSGDPTFRTAMHRVRDVAVGAYAHQELPFERLVEELQPERTLSHAPVVQVIFTVDDLTVEVTRLGDLAVRMADVGTHTAKFELGIRVVDHPDGLTVTAEYRTELFEPATVERMLDHLVRLLQAAVSDPDQRLSDLPMLADTERRQLLVEWNDTATDLPAAQTVHALVEGQAARTPGAPAVADREQELTYAQLDARANQLAHHLRSLGAGHDTLVGVCLERGVDLPVALLGILKAAAAYLPLDPDLPPQRLAHMLDDSRSRLLLTQSSLLHRLPDGRGGQTVCLDTDAQAIDAHPDTSPGVPCHGSDLAYLIYTSGSTGTPKGVMVEHRSVVNLLDSMRREPGIGPGDVLLAVTTLCFDIAALELFLPLVAGARLAIAGPGVAADGTRLADRIAETGATLMQATPSTWRMLLDAGWQGDPGLRVLCGGEALDRPLATRLVSRTAELWNLYGPTETTIWSAVHRVEPGTGPVPIGRPIANTSIHLLDARLQPVPVGVPGELCIGGTGVARGYLHRPDLTAERFLPDPFSDRPGARIYRTGDLARRLADGSLECLGRLDHQVKIRGHRVECGEVEATLLAHPQVRQVAVVARDEEGGGHRLVAYVVAAGDTVPTTTELRAHLRLSLPDHMVPAAYVTVDALPTTPNGKLDRGALPAPQGRPELRAAYTGPRTPTEEVLAGLWAELLGLDRVGVDDNFFELGGHSLLAARLVAAIERRCGVRLPLALLFEDVTVERLALALDQERGVSEAWTSLLAIRPQGGRPPLFLAPTVHGEVVEYRDLIRHLDPDQPVYGLRAIGLDGRRHPHTTVEDMAGHYIGEIRQVRPEGPYLLAGFCFGGVVAFEMARQLQQQGEVVALLAIIDVAPVDHSSEPRLTPWKRAALRMRNLPDAGSRTRLASVVRLLRSAVAGIHRRLWFAAHDHYLRAGRPLPRFLQNIGAVNYRAMLAYVAQTCPCPLTLVAAEDASSESAMLPLWQPVAAGGIVLHRIGGDGLEHLNLMKEPYVGAVAETLSSCIEKARRQ